jgi:hypothetical protein
MRWLALLLILTETPAFADPDQSNGFVSAGVSVGFGTRGLVVGVEVSAGRYLDVTDGIGYTGLAGGFEIATAPGSHEPRGRLYGELELGALFGGAGVGPTLLFDRQRGREVGVQMTPYLAVSPELVPNAGSEEPFVVYAPFYRYTYRACDRGLHDGGVFVKSLWFPNGRWDRGISIH